MKIIPIWPGRIVLDKCNGSRSFSASGREGGLEEVTEACRMGMEALKAQLAAEDETMTAAQPHAKQQDSKIAIFLKGGDVYG